MAWLDTGWRQVAGFAASAVIGVAGGLIGLGGAEFRLPLLIGAFRFRALEAVILNKATSLVVVASALAFRTATVPPAAIAAHWAVVANLLAGSLLGAWLGAGVATRLRAETLHRVIAVLLVAIAALLLFDHDPTAAGRTLLDGPARVVVGVVAGFAIGGVAAVLGVAGGELLIPTLVLLFGADVKLAGSLSLAVSLPTMVVGLARYSRDASFAALGRHRRFMLAMAAGSILGGFIGGWLLGIVPGRVLLPLLAGLLLVSAVKVWGHGRAPASLAAMAECDRRPRAAPRPDRSPDDP